MRQRGLFRSRLLSRLRGERSTHPRLHPKCPKCGGNVNPAEVEWVDGTAAICDYCGSTLQASA